MDIDFLSFRDGFKRTADFLFGDSRLIVKRSADSAGKIKVRFLAHVFNAQRIFASNGINSKLFCGSFGQLFRAANRVERLGSLQVLGKFAHTLFAR